jgi:hypothetical protein
VPHAIAHQVAGLPFFPHLISGPFHHGLVVVFGVGAGLGVIAALASLLIGGRPVKLAGDLIDPLESG